jgi:hypothetical protein
VNRTRPSLQKREREKAKREKQVAKAARRADVKAHKVPGSGMDDSDLAAIVPGPQPKPWDDEPVS